MFIMKASIDFTIQPMLIELHVKLLLLPRHNKIHTQTPPLPVPSPDEKGGGGTQTAT